MQNGHDPDGPPEGAVLLTEEMFERATKKALRLPAMSRKVARMTSEELVKEEFLTPVEKWPATLRAKLRSEIAEKRVPADVVDRVKVIEVETKQISDADLLEERAARLKEHGVWVWIQPVGYTEAMMIQPLISEEADWPKEGPERRAAAEKWFNALDEENKQKYLEAVVEANYKFVTLGLMEPKLRPAQVRRFKDDLGLLVVSIQKMSGLLPEATEEAPAEEAAPPEEPTETPAEAAPTAEPQG